MCECISGRNASSLAALERNGGRCRQHQAVPYTTGAVTANCTVNASFGVVPPASYPINISASAGGSVVCSPNPVPHGASTATPNTGRRLTGWGGQCSGNTPSCTLAAVTSATSVTAQFAPQAASAQAIPTLGEWAMLLLSGLMGIAALGVLRRR